MSWTSSVLCEHTAIVAREETVAGWPTHAACAHSTRAGAWTVGVSAPTPEERERVHAEVVRLSAADLPSPSAIARLSRADLPECSVLLSDGDLAVGLAWGRPLGLAELGGWEFVLAAEPVPEAAWQPLSPGTIVVLDSCGPTVFPVPYPKDLA